MTARRRWIAIALAAASLVIVNGCGGGDDEKTTPAAATDTSAQGTAGAASISMDEYRFDPGDINVDRGATLTVSNDGKIAHNLTVEQGPDPKKKTKDLIGTPTFLPGKSEKLTVDLDPGRYAIVCTVPGHRQLGMTGTLTVK
jgi:uncharacterized cupredoxin-like copper-binding protein